MTRGSQISLLVTIGIAAIDLLTCAFVSSVVLFVMFLVPSASGGTAEVGDPNDILMLDWTYATAKLISRPVIAIHLGHGDDQVTVWSDMSAGQIDDACLKLSRAHDTKGHCSVSQSASDSGGEGILLITQPVKAQWSVGVAYADTEDNANSGNYPPLEMGITIVGKSVVDLSGMSLKFGDGLTPLDRLAGQNASDLERSLDFR
jgi:hypothetical protein